MKLIIILVSIILSSFNMSAQESLAVQPEFLTGYFQLRDALTAGDATTAASKADLFLKTVNGVDYKVISEGNIKILAKDAERITTTTDIEKQRLYFANLSDNMATVVKSIRLSKSPVHIAYCPMKNAYWLTAVKEIKNPYYGNKMLACGEIKQTF